ncbi:unnamed protein product [Calypogeia fissa]
MAEVCKIRKRIWMLLRFLVVAMVLGQFPSTAMAQTLLTTLTSTYYDSSCSGLQTTALNALKTQLQADGRVGASILRLHFHDCFVQGCDGSDLLDDTANFTGEKNAGPNANSLRGFSAVDAIKSDVEGLCSATVSCAGILALAARDAVVEAGGPSWTVEFGRLDGVTASPQLANTNLPNPNSNVQTLTSDFANQGLSQIDMVALSGAHTFGKTQCGTISPRLYNFQNSGTADPTINSAYLGTLQGECPNGGSTSTTVDLDQATPVVFDNAYYANLLTGKGTLFSDQALESEGGSTASTVNGYSGNQNQFFDQFANSVIKMGRIGPPSGSTGQVRLNCRKVNG